MGALRAHWKVALVGVALLGVGIGVGTAATSRTKTRVDRTYKVVTVFNDTSKTVTVTRYHIRARIVEGGLKTVFGDGRYSVGRDVAPGTYDARGGRRCYWQRSVDPAGMQVLANDFSNGEPASLTVHVGENIYTRGCGKWHRQ